MFICTLTAVSATPCRCVAEQQRTLALGVQSVMWRLFGSIPGPIIFGAVFDSTCIFWQRECGRRGNCWVYENSELSERALAIGIIGVFLNFFFSFLCWLVYPRQNEGTTASTDKQKGNENEVSLSELEGDIASNRQTSKAILVPSTEDNDISSLPGDRGGGSPSGKVTENSDGLVGAW